MRAMEDPAEALNALAIQLRDEGSVISPHVVDPGEASAALGLLAAAGPRTAGAPFEYAVLVESIREGYLLHYSKPRLVNGADDDLALLAGDYIYACGLERLAALGDLEAVRELSDLISLAAQLHAANRTSNYAEEGSRALWLASVTAVAAGPGPAHGEAKSAVRRGEPGAATALWESARQVARSAGLDDALERTAEAIGFRLRIGTR
jgi:hypothetical protein